MERTKTALILLSTLLLPLSLFATSGARAPARDAGQIVPSITVSDAVGTKPGTVYTSGQTPRTVNVAWNAGSDWTDCEIYYTVNDLNQAELGRGHDGVKPLTVTAGNAYHLWMVVYPGGGKFKVVTELRLVAEEGMQPSSPPVSAGAVRINRIRVEPGPNHVIIRFTALPNQRPYVAIGRGPAVTQNNELVFGENLVGGGIIGLETVTDAEKARGEYMFASAVGSTISEDGLQPGATYYYTITIPADGSRRAEQYTDKFTMLGLTTTVRVQWDKIIVEDDSDDLSNGEILMWLWANYGQPSQKYSAYANDDVDSDHTYDLNKTVVIENAPNALSLAASGRDSDAGVSSGAFVDDDAQPAPLSGPADKVARDENVAKGEFDLTQYAEKSRIPFRLNSMPGGSFKFVILGSFEYSRATVGLGAPSTVAIRPQARVRGEGTTLSAPPICVAAKQARERNSPAAPGLEAKCLAQEPVKPQPRVKQPDGTTTKSTLTKCEAAKQARARNSPAARGLEAQCLEEQKR
jgi:hypothetical protein